MKAYESHHGDELRSTRLEQRYKTYARWFQPKVAIKLLIQMKSITDVKAFLRSEYRAYLQILFAVARDTIVVYQSLNPKDAKPESLIQPNRVHQALRSAPETYERHFFPQTVLG
jgi:hypothetical protein